MNTYINLFVGGVVTGYVTLTLILVYLFRKRTVIKQKLTKKRTLPKLPWLKILIWTVWAIGLFLLIIAAYFYAGGKV